MLFPVTYQTYIRTYKQVYIAPKLWKQIRGTVSVKAQSLVIAF